MEQKTHHSVWRTGLSLKFRKSTKTAERGAPWVPAIPGNDIQVMDPPKITAQPEPRDPALAKKSFPLPDPLRNRWEDVRPRGRIRVLAESFLGKLIISPSFLISSLLVFFLIPHSVLKGSYSIDLRAHCREALQRLVDILGASIILILTAPIFLVAPILIKLDSPGCVFYKQVRVGQDKRRHNRRKSSYRLKGDRRNGDRRKENTHGQLFVVYKFRSMRQDAEKKSGPVWAKKADPRITKVGKLLRATRSDELPQLLNILKGDMSLVGPRPERPHFVSQFVDTISDYHERLKVKPGLTGYAQVMGGYDTCIEDVLCKLNYDLHYVHNKSFGQDVKILLKTIVVVVCGKGVC